MRLRQPTPGQKSNSTDQQLAADIGNDVGAVPLPDEVLMSKSRGSPVHKVVWNRGALSGVLPEVGTELLIFESIVAIVGERTVRDIDLIGLSSRKVGSVETCELGSLLESSVEN
jgi:hypothetical protein